MLRKISALILTLILTAAMLVPSGTAFAAARTSYSIKDATKYIGTAGNNMNVYGSFMVMGNNAGAEFSVFVSEAKKYNIIGRMSCANTATVSTVVGSHAAVEAVVATGALTSYTEVLLATVEMQAGYATVTIRCIAGSLVQFSDLYIEEASGKVELDFSKKEGAFKNHWLPAVIEAEDFDFNSSRSTGQTSPIKQAYREDSVLEIKTGTGARTALMNRGDSAAYTFKVLEDGLFDVSVFAENSGTIKLYFDENAGYVTATTVSLAETPLGTVSLAQGTHIVRIESAAEALPVDKIRFKSAKNSAEYYRPSDLTEGKCITIEQKEEEKTENPIWQELYVSPEGSDKASGSKNAPFKTIEAAKEAAKRLSAGMKGDIVINLLPGTYPISETIQFTEEDSGKNGYNIVYKGTDANNKPILSGGKKITGWEKLDGHIWFSKVAEDVETVRQLYINEFPARLARSKYIYAGERAYDDPMTEFKEDGFYISKKNFPQTVRPEDMELLFPFMWCLHYFPVADVIDAGEEWLIKYDQPYFGRYLQGAASHSTPTAGISVFVNNLPELMDEPGEFYYDNDTRTVYYYAFPEEDLKEASVFTPSTHVLINGEGKGKDNRLENIAFENLDFRHGSWNDIARTGIFTGQGDSKIPPDAENKTSVETWQRDMVPAQLEFSFAKNISFIGCNFVNLGSSALAMRNNVIDSSVEGNIFRDIAGSAIVVGNINYNSASTVEDVSRNISIKNNVLRRIGHDYMNSVGIMIFYANSVDAMHNDIKYTPYTGISIGWGWGSSVSNAVRSGEHRIANNRIDHTSQAVYDGGAIYTLSEMKGMYIEGNHMSNSPDSGGIYFDSGSKSITARDNVFDNNAKNTLYGGVYITDIYRNYANYVEQGTSTVWLNGASSKGEIERPIRTEGDNWGPEARAIMENAGLEAEYKYLLSDSKLELPDWRTMSIRLLYKNLFESPTEVIVHATDWIPGGEGVAFHEINDKEPEDYGRKGSFVGNTYAGEWIKYNAPVKEPGNYEFNLYYALQSASGDSNLSNATAVDIWVDGSKIADAVPVGDTGSWNSYVRMPIAKIELTEGDHEVKIEFVNGGFALGRFELVSTNVIGNDVNYDDGVLFKLPSE